MRSLGTRPPVAKLIEESSVISDSDVLYSYIKEITRFYSSEYKTNSEILSQFKIDIGIIVSHYKMACGMSLEKDVRGLSKSLNFLMWETANMGLFLNDETLIELGLDKVLLERPIEQMGEEWSELDRFTDKFGFELGLQKFREKYPEGTIKPTKVLRSVYDCTFVYYKNRKPDGNGMIPKDIVLPSWKDVDDKIKALFIYPENYNNFLNGCFLPNGKVKEIKYIVDSYNVHRSQKPETIQKGVPTLLYEFLRDNGIIIIPEDKPKSKLRSFQREFEKLKV